MGTLSNDSLVFGHRIKYTMKLLLPVIFTTAVANGMRVGQEQFDMSKVLSKRTAQKNECIKLKTDAMYQKAKMMGPHMERSYMRVKRLSSTKAMLEAKAEETMVNCERQYADCKKLTPLWYSVDACGKAVKNCFNQKCKEYSGGIVGRSSRG